MSSSSFFAIDDIRAALQQGHWVITANQRLASRILNAYAIASTETGAEVVETPRVVSLQHWTQQQWLRAIQSALPEALSLRVLDSDSEWFIWQQLLQQDDAAVLLNPRQTASQLQSAWELVGQWQIDLQQDSVRQSFTANPDTEAFYRLASAFSRYCQQQGRISSVQRDALLIQWFRQGLLARTGAIVAVGFESMPPLQQQLLNAAGELSLHQSQQQPAAVSAIAVERPEQELYQALVWAKHCLQDQDKTRLAIVIPDLRSRLVEVERVVQHVFAPEQLAPAAPRHAPVINISAGQRFDQLPLVQAALDVLQLANSEMSLQQAERILLSPFYASNPSHRQRAAATVQALYQLQHFTISSARLRQLAQQQSSAEQPWPWAEKLQQLAESLRRLDGQRKRPLSSWIQHWQQLLAEFGWPGERSLDSIEYQQLQQWQQQLQHFSALGEHMPELGYTAALGYWQQYLSRQVFQAQTEETPIQILGLLESSGLQFDKIWLTGMSHRQWPANATANPFIPSGLQRQLSMPGSSAEHEWHYARGLSENFRRNCQQLIVSFPASDNDIPNVVSPLFSDSEAISLDQLLAKPIDHYLPLHTMQQQLREQRQWQAYSLAKAPVLDQSGAVNGGVSILANQSACPFRAMARNRLGLQSLAEPYLGLSAADRGSLLHRALCLIWQKLKSRAALEALEYSARQQLVAQAVSYAVIGLSRQIPDRLGPRAQQLETARLNTLIEQWLELELQRDDFVVEYCEHSLQSELKGLPLRGRVDRIDRLSDGSLIVVDYKTGKVSRQVWYDNRPEDPQLPLYSLMLQQQQQTVSGLMFAQVKSNDLRWLGLAVQDCAESSIRWTESSASESGAPDWDGLNRHWQRALEKLASDFVNGVSTIDPKDNASCRYCDLGPLCRIDRQHAVAENEND